MLVVCLASLVAVPVISAAGAGGCPTAQQVAARLEGLLGATPGPPDRVDLGVRGAALEVRLSRADGTLVASREIARDQSCAEQAEAAAVLIAAWQADLHGGVAQPAVPLPAARMVPVADASAPRPPTIAYEIGAAPALWFGGGPVSFVGAVRGAAWSREGPLGMTAALSATFPVEDSPAEGGARWRRIALTGGIIGRLSEGRVFLDGLAEVVLGWLVVEGEGFQVARSRGAFDPGGSVGLRAGARLTGRWEAWASLAGWAALWEAQVEGEGGTRTTAFSRWGLLAGVGVSATFGR